MVSACRSWRNFSSLQTNCNSK